MSSPLTGPLRNVTLRTLEQFGAPVVFRREVPGEHDPVTETFTAPTVTELPGYAVRGRGDRDTYLRLGLSYARNPTLVFAPDPEHAGTLPVGGDTVVWAGRTYTVAEVAPVEPDGDALLCRVVLQ